MTKTIGLYIVLLLLLCPLTKIEAYSDQVDIVGVGSYPSNMAVADFNDDGVLDFSVSSRISSGVSVFLSDTQNQIFSENLISSTTAQVADMQALDRNRDGKSDLIFSQIDGTSFLRSFNNLGGSFSPSQIVGGAAAIIETITTADVNNDGKSEIVTTQSYSGDNGGLIPLTKYVVILKPDSTNQYFAALESLPFKDYLTAADAGDIDGDGYIDFAASSNVSGGNEEGQAGDVSVWFNSNGRLAQGVTTVLEAIPNISQVKIADVTGDQVNELLVASKDLGLMIFTYDGNHNFDSPVVVPMTQNIRALSVVDLNDDGKNEIALITESPNGVVVTGIDYKNNQFYVTDSIIISDIKLPAFSSSNSLSHGSDIDIVAIDYDFDGTKEILVPGNTISTDNSTMFVVKLEPVYLEITNSTPELIVDNQTIAEGDTLSFFVSATDGDNDPLTYSAANLPAGAIFDPQTQTFSWTPDFDDAGTYEVVFTVSDGELSDTATATIEVLNTNRAPILDPIGNQTTAENQTLAFTVSASDPDGDTLTYTAANLPSGATFDPQTGVFSWTPGYSDASNYENVEFSVMDDGEPMEVAVELITITVGNVNRAPVLLSPGAQEVLEDEPLQFSIVASDPDNDSFTLAATNLPSGASFNTQTGEFTWTPSLSQEGIYTVTFTAADAGTPVETGTVDVVITVGDNPTPVEQSEDIIDAVVVLDLPNNVENAYMANLQKVATFIEQGKIQAAINQLDAFINKVNQDYAQGTLTQAEHDDLVGAAENLIDDID